MFPSVAPSVLAKAKSVWKQSIQQYGRSVELISHDLQTTKQVKAFAKRPKVMGQFDRTEQSYDQERYMLILDADDFPLGTEQPEKFMRAKWDGEEHLFISVTQVDLSGIVFGYRVMVKG